MKVPAVLFALLLLAACASDPAASTVAPPPPVTAAPVAAASGGEPAAGKAVVTTTTTRRVCENADSTGSRLKRPTCRDVPEGSEKGYRDDLLREKTDELRSYDEANTLRTSQDVFGR